MLQCQKSFCETLDCDISDIAEIVPDEAFEENSKQVDDREAQIMER